MKKITLMWLMLFVIIFLSASTWHREMIGNTPTDVSCEPMTWIKMGADINALETFSQNVDFWFLLGQEYPTIGISKECAELLKQKFLNGEWREVLIPSGAKYDFEIYSGVWHTQKARIAEITTGPIFDKIYASAYVVEADDPVYSNHVSGAFFANELNGKKQCNNFCGNVEPLSKPKVQIEPEIRYVPQPYPVPGPVVYDTIRVETEKLVEGKPYFKWCGWAYYHRDFNQDPVPNILQIGENEFVDIQSSDDNIIQSSMINITAKLYIHDYALIAGGQWSYQDNPVDGYIKCGFEYSNKQKIYWENGFLYRLYQDINYNTVFTTLPDGSISFRTRGIYFGLNEAGVYSLFDLFIGNSGKNHLSLWLNQCFRPEAPSMGTSEISGSLKLEPGPIYLFGAGKYQLTPKYNSNDYVANKFEYKSCKLRIGSSILRSLIVFTEGVAIDQENFEDNINPWSYYTRRDANLGLFYRPQSFLGMSKIYFELTCGLSRIEETYKNVWQNRTDDLINAKLTAFYNWKF
jgi:hypothetical protein